MKNPCQKGYTAYGFKMKDGARVPNCVPLKEENIQELSLVKKVKAKIARAFSLDSPVYRPTHINPQTGEQSGARTQGDYARAKMYRRDKYAEKRKIEKMASANTSAKTLTQKMHEELGHDNEWGRPQLTKKMLNADHLGRITTLVEENPGDTSKENTKLGFNIDTTLLKIFKNTAVSNILPTFFSEKDWLMFFKAELKATESLKNWIHLKKEQNNNDDIKMQEQNNNDDQQFQDRQNIMDLAQLMEDIQITGQHSSVYEGQIHS